MKKKFIVLLSTLVVLATQFSVLTNANPLNELPGHEELTIKNKGDYYIAENSSVKITVSKMPYEEVKLKSDEVQYGVKFPMQAQSEKATRKDNEFVFSKLNSTYSTSLEVDKDVLLYHNIIESNKAPTEYRVEFNLPEGAYMEYALNENDEKDGSIIIYDKDKRVLGAIGKPLVSESSNNLSVQHEIDGHTVIQKVNTENITEPNIVTMAMYIKRSFGFYFKSSSKYVNGSGTYGKKFSLVRDMNSFASDIAAGYSVLAMSWDPVYAKYSGYSGWYNTDGLYKQYKCHYYQAGGKGTWNIEPARPNVSYNAHVLAACNPK